MPADPTEPQQNPPTSLSLSIPPPDPDLSHFIIDFPGYVRNEDRALATLDGLEGLARQRHSHRKTLQCKLRPGDPYCHPLISDQVRNTTGFLLRLTRSTPEASGAASSGGFQAAVVAAIDHRYTFSSPADYQYVGRDRRPSEAQWAAREDRGEDDPSYVPRPVLLCTPPWFAVEGSLDYSFQQYKAADHGADVLGRRARRASASPMIDFFAANVPTEATGATGQDAVSAALVELFARRPVYLEGALAQAMAGVTSSRPSGGAAAAPSTSSATSAGASSAASPAPPPFPASRSHQEALNRQCYRFRNGPWKGAWVRRGYDPRSDPTSRRYQVLEYTLPAEWYTRLVQHAALGVSATHPSRAKLPAVAASYAALCAFAGLPSAAATALQLCDLEDEELRTALGTSSSVAATVSDGGGWLVQSAWEAVKSRVSGRFQKLLAAAEEALKQDKAVATIALPSGMMMELERYLRGEKGAVEALGRAAAVEEEEAVLSGGEDEEEEEEEEDGHEDEDDDDDDEGQHVQ